jgi:hypothetical protein
VDGRTEGRTIRETGITKLIVAFRDFANVPKRRRKQARSRPDITEQNAHLRLKLNDKAASIKSHM